MTDSRQSKTAADGKSKIVENRRSKTAAGQRGKVERSMKWIVACDRNGGIGKDGKLLVRLPSDMKYFREKTVGKTVIMGRATLESFPGGKPLPDRRNIVLSKRLPYSDSYEVCRSVEELLELVKEEDADGLFVIGGGQIYRLLLPYCDEALVTEIDAVFEADTTIPLLSEEPGWERTQVSDPLFENGVSYAFAVYRRK